MHAKQQRSSERKVETRPAELVHGRDRHGPERQAGQPRCPSRPPPRQEASPPVTPAPSTAARRTPPRAGERRTRARRRRHASSHWRSSTATTTGPLGRQDAQRAEEGCGHGPLVGRCVAGVRQEQRDFERAPLGRGSAGERLELTGEQVAQACERELHLGPPGRVERTRYPRPRPARRFLPQRWSSRCPAPLR